jgi:hypothetical protein
MTPEHITLVQRIFTDVLPMMVYETRITPRWAPPCCGRCRKG